MVSLDSTFSVVPFTIGAAPDYRNDDGSSSSIPLPFSFNFYGNLYDSIFINNNGNISFNAPYFTFTANPFPDSTYSMIAPFWADVDTRDSASGLVYYKITPTAMIVKWENVGYYASHSDKVNTFQLIITDGTDPLLPAGTNVSFCYGDMQWTTGDASMGVGGFGGVAATVGVNQGDGTDYFQVGTFDTAGIAFDGPYGHADQVDWLDNQGMYFNTAILGNIPPVIINNNICDTIDVYTGDTTRALLFNIVNLTLGASTPEIGQIVTATVTCSAPTAFTSVESINTNTYKQFDCSFSAVGLSPGIYSVTIVATDNGVPVKQTTKTIYIKTHYDPAAPLGITEYHATQSISIYPNPADESITVNQNFNASSNPVLSIVNVIGQDVLTAQLNNQQQTIGISNLAKGVYFATITSNEGKSKT
ncbi:MAG TPA: nidogen-like domain-containing protein, partial [Bacteroidia bacterium]|nr:nidogen-like domain-containing protein [Bacteroidia bacterium]